MSGRPSIKGISARKKKFVRRGYTYEFKQAVLEEMKTSGTEVGVVRFWPDARGERKANTKRMVRKWMREKAKILEIAPVLAAKKMKIRPDGVSTVIPEEIEERIANWVRALRADGAPVSRELVVGKVMSEISDMPEYEGFKASFRWLEGFLRRHKFTMRMKTSQVR